jgi:hypothetical protein
VICGVPGVGVVHRDHPVFGDLAGDPPPPVPAVGALSGLHVLPGDQRQKRHRGGGRLLRVRVPDRGHQRGRSDFASRLRQYTSEDGSNPGSSSGTPIAAFHRTSNFTASAVSRSE